MSNGRDRSAGAGAVFLWLGLGILSVAALPLPSPQDDAQIRPRSDYMRDILSRNTKAIGLIADPILQKMMSQTGRKWAVRSSARHILD
jgi:hypothetical protein